MIRKSDIEIEVAKCIGSNEWVWMIIEEQNGVLRDGYAESKAEAMKNARQAREEELENVNSDD